MKKNLIIIMQNNFTCFVYSINALGQINNNQFYLGFDLQRYKSKQNWFFTRTKIKFLLYKCFQIIHYYRVLSQILTDQLCHCLAKYQILLGTLWQIIWWFYVLCLNRRHGLMWTIYKLILIKLNELIKM